MHSKMCGRIRVLSGITPVAGEPVVICQAWPGLELPFVEETEGGYLVKFNVAVNIVGLIDKAAYEYWLNFPSAFATDRLRSARGEAYFLFRKNEVEELERYPVPEMEVPHETQLTF